jgi:hypothetical protein
MLCCLTIACGGSTCIKESRLGCTYATVTSEALMLCCLTTAYLGSTYNKMSRLGCAYAIVTPEVVLIMHLLKLSPTFDTK